MSTNLLLSRIAYVMFLITLIAGCIYGFMGLFEEKILKILIGVIFLFVSGALADKAEKLYQLHQLHHSYDDESL